MKRLLLAALLILAAPALASAAHGSYADAPTWARNSDYQPSYSTSTHWYDDTHRRAHRTNYIYHDIYHPPRVWYVHRNENFYRTHAGTRTAYRTTYAAHRAPVYHGNGFSRYY